MDWIIMIFQSECLRGGWSPDQLTERGVPGLGAGRRILVSMEDRPRRTEDGIDILPPGEFARRLWKGRLTGA